MEGQTLLWGPSRDPADPLAKAADCLPSGGGRCRHEPAVKVQPCRALRTNWPALLGGVTGTVKPHDITGAVALLV